MYKEKPSRTACKVALNIITLGVKDGMNEILPAGIVEATEKLLLASEAAKPKYVKWANSQRAVSMYERFDWMMPGQFEAFAYRKAFCENQVVDSIKEGTNQILVLGAGYDTLGWRLAPKYPEVKFFEIDHPATANLKAKGIKAMGERKNLHLIAQDLGKSKLEDVLNSCEFWDTNAKTVIIAEGLLQYLAPEAVRDLFKQCALVTDSESRIVFTYTPAGPDGKPDAGPKTKLVLWILKLTGEPWLWSISPEDIGSFLKDLGWKYSPELLESKEKHGVEFYCAARKG